MRDSFKPCIWIFVLSFFFFSSDVCADVYNCWSSSGLQQGQWTASSFCTAVGDGTMTLWKNTIIPNGAGLSCTDASIMAMTDASNYTNTCTGFAAIVDYDPNNCNIICLAVCCPGTEGPPTNPLTEDSIVSDTALKQVAVGSEKSACQQWFQSWAGSNSYPDHTGEGLVRTDGMSGYSYVTSQDADGLTMDVYCTAWLRGGYSKNVGGTTLEPTTSGGGGGSGGGYNGPSDATMITDIQTALGSTSGQASLSNAVGTGLVPTATLLHGDLVAINTTLSTGGSSVSGGLTADQFNAGLASALAGTYTGGNGTNSTPYAYGGTLTGSSGEVPTGSLSAMSTAFSNFSTSMKSTGLATSIGGFFGGITSYSGSPPVITIDGGSTFGSYNLDMSVFSPALSILSGIVYMIFGYISVKHVAKGGG